VLVQDTYDAHCRKPRFRTRNAVLGSREVS
jgi:hypothetical protein